MNCAVFHSINSRSAPSALRSASELSDANSSSSTRRYGPSIGTEISFPERACAIEDQVRVAANRRSEMRVLLRRQREMAEQVGSVARLLERAQHQVGKYSF